MQEMWLHDDSATVSVRSPVVSSRSQGVSLVTRALKCRTTGRLASTVPSTKPGPPPGEVLSLPLPGGTPLSVRSLRAFRLFLAVSLFCVTGMPSRAPGIEGPPPGYKVAFIGDQGLGPISEAVLQLIADEGADAVLHVGDLDYADDPAAWEAQIDGILGPDFPYFTSVGNHDTAEWYVAGGYQERIAARMDRLGIPWEGDLGVQSTFRYEGIFYVLTAAGTVGAGDGNHDLYIADALSQTDAIWRVSGWHENMQRMQVGEKSDSTGWGVYEESRRGGAVIATGHSHTYSRTHLLSNMESQVIASIGDPLVLAADDPDTPDDEGRSFVFVTGIAGRGIRDQRRDGDWWASVYTRDQAAEHGALFAEFGHAGDPRMARFYLKDITGAVVDEFLVQSSVGSGAPGLSIDDISLLEGDSGTQDAAFTVSLSAIPEQDVRVEFMTADGTAVSGSDYVALSGVLLFQPGETTRTIRVPVVGDGVPEDTETFVVSLDPPGGVYDPGTLVTLTAQPDAGHMLRSWLGAVTGTENPVTLLVDADKSVTALFARPTLTAVAGANGSLELDPPGGVYDVGSVVSVTAVPDADHFFAGWSGDLVGTSNPAALVMDRDRVVLAGFEANPRVTLEPTPAGGVTLDPPGGVYAPGTSVTLAATPAPGYEFVGWGGDLAGSDNPATLVVDLDRNVAARFDPLPASLEESKSGASTDADSVATDSALLGVEGQLYLASIAFKPDVAVSDVSGLGLVWEPVAAQCGGRGQTGVSLWRARGQPLGDGVVTATLASAPRAAVITVSRYAGSEGTGALVSANTLGLAGSCSGGTDDAAYALDLDTSTPGSQVHAAVAMRNRDHQPGPGWSEQAESYAGSGGSAAGLAVATAAAEQPSTVRVLGLFDGDVDWAVVAAEVLRPAAQLSLTLGASHGGGVSLDPPGGLYEAGTSVTLTATPDPGRAFAGWSGDLSGGENPTTLVMDGHKSVTARFEGTSTVSITPVSGGGIALDPPGGSYLAGTIVGVTATPDAGFLFRGWTGDLGGSENPTLLAVDGDKTVGAVFSRPTLEIVAGSNGSVTLDPPGGVYDAGSAVTLTAVPAAGHFFAGWGGDLAGSSNPAVLLMDSDKSVSASFTSALGVTLTATLGGSVSLDPPGGVYAPGTFVTLTAQPDAGYLFSRWSGDLSGSQNPASLLVDAEKTVGAVFERPTLTVSAGSNGDVILDPPGGVYDAGSVVTLTAVPDAGHAFDGWGGDLSGADNPATLLMDDHKSVSASFGASRSVTVDVSAGGVVTLDPPGGVYAPGTFVTLTASPVPGYEFVGWGGDLAGTDNPASLLVDDDRNVSARFDPLPVALLEVQTGASEEADTLATDAPLLAAADQLYLAAIASKPNTTVTDVSGLGLVWEPVAAQCSARDQTGVTLWRARGQPSGDDVVTASFDGAPRAALITVSRYGGADGTGTPVSANTLGVAGGCSGGTDDAGYALDLVTTAPGSRIHVAVAMRNRDHLPAPTWSEQAETYAGSGGSIAGLSVAQGAVEQPALVSVDGSFNSDVDWAVVALEVSRSVALLSLSIGSSPGGSVSLDPPGGAYEAGTPVTLTATPDPGQVFTGWIGDLSGADNPATLVMDDHKTVSARFEETLTVSVASAAGGSVVLDPPGTAHPDAGYLFTGWIGDLSGSDNPATLLVDTDKSLGAVFVRPTLVVSAGPNGSVTLDPPGGVYDAGSVVTLTAVPDAGHAFSGWGGDLAGGSNPATLVMDGHRSVSASFTAAPGVTVAVEGGGSVTLDPPGGVYPPGTSVTFTATPASGYEFAGWSGDLVGSENPTTLLVDGDRSITAHFDPLPIALEELKSGTSEDRDTVATDAPLAAVEGHLYLAAVAFKPDVIVTDVSGLGLVWEPVAAQCGARSQTGIALWQARGQPLGDGVVTASFASTPRAAVITVSRYAGAEGTGAPVSANTSGVAGSCSGGSDDTAYAFDLATTAPGSRVHVAVAMRNKDHVPGPGWSEQAESYAGSGGSAAGLSVALAAAEQPALVSVEGSFSSDVDWAVVAVEVHTPIAPQ
jgi:hypothetical protein